MHGRERMIAAITRLRNYIRRADRFAGDLQNGACDNHCDDLSVARVCAGDLDRIGRLIHDAELQLNELRSIITIIRGIK